MRILLTEDDPALADLLLRACRQEGYSVDWVSDGVAADLALSSETYDALVLDLGLPRMDGLDVLKRLRKRGSHLPVMILTAREAIADRVEAGTLGLAGITYQLAEGKAELVDHIGDIGE